MIHIILGILCWPFFLLGCLWWGIKVMFIAGQVFMDQVSK